MIEKNNEYTLDIVSQGYEGEGIAKVDGFTLFIPGAIKGEKVRVKVIKVKKNYGYGKLVEVLLSSEERRTERCSHYNRCGGCSISHMSYKEQLNFKYSRVKDCISKIGGLSEELVLYPLGMEGEPYRYRNKVQLPVGKVNGEIVIGFYAQRSHDIINLDSCLIQHELGEDISAITKRWMEKYNIEPYTIDGIVSPKGLIRHIMIRKAYGSNESMVVLVATSSKVPYLDEFVKMINEEKPQVTSVILNVNGDKTNVILGQKCITLYGGNKIMDSIGEFKFNISPLSFFQVNPTQTNVLYNKALEYADLQGDEVVFDAYCGTGTITLFLSQNAKKVYGVEIIDAAIENAKENSRINNVHNVEFIVGKSEEEIPKLLDKGIKVDIIVVDPPRKGCDVKLLKAIGDSEVEKVVYVSCDPSTLARDLKILTDEGYKVEKVQPVDMFPQTSHIEVVTLLTRVEN